MGAINLQGILRHTKSNLQIILSGLQDFHPLWLVTCILNTFRSQDLGSLVLHKKRCNAGGGERCAAEIAGRREG